MDRRQLTTALLEAGLPPESFQITGIHSHEPVPTDFWFLRPAPSGWDVGMFERGTYEVREHFPTEPEATAWLYQTMTGEPAP
ncbi:hypothetical protein [Nocardia pseudobrasiliensis]|uniref:Uncharacterized protein n=1 Tax=Nocardia pseudobrasiliensis TaxID=45979 RepID=A0A370HZP4_9NOCA|nr:hypothetical protein [Nocardia pseudobrasiliensis]RDI63962.1 hypothetical protein DFR76_109302 [Nocardia pseudobrasiliensis]